VRPGIGTRKRARVLARHFAGVDAGERPPDGACHKPRHNACRKAPDEAGTYTRHHRRYRRPDCRLVTASSITQRKQAFEAGAGAVG